MAANDQRGLSRILVYLLLILLPLLVVTAYHLPPPDLFAYNLGRSFALAAFAILILQVALAARLPWIEKPFGLNLTFPFHRRMGLLAALLLLCHPFLLALGGGGWHLLLGDNTWYLWVGRLAWLTLFINVSLSLWRLPLGLKFEDWRRGHSISGPLIIVLAFVHSWCASADFNFLC